MPAAAVAAFKIAEILLQYQQNETRCAPRTLHAVRGGGSICCQAQRLFVLKLLLQHAAVERMPLRRSRPLRATALLAR
jgi:hypothetical protein